jgi:hypothetical protein
VKPLAGFQREFLGAICADSREFDSAALASIAEGKRAALTLRLQPGAAILHSEHPIVSIWEANQDGRDGTPERDSGAEWALVFRDGFQVRVVVVGSSEARLLEAVRDGLTLGAMASDPQIAPGLPNELQRWTRIGVIDGFS